MKKRWLVMTGFVVLIAALWWLRDPAWLGDYTAGLKDVATDGTGRAYRWTEGRSSFYVPTTWAITDLDLAGPEQNRTRASIYVDGRLLGRLLLDEGWQTVPVATGTVPTTRRYRRIDIHVTRTSEDQRGVRLGWPAREQ